MKHLYYLWQRGLLAALLVGLTAGASHAQALGWQSVLGTAGQHNAHVNSMAADASGNIILAGYFNGRMDLGNGIVLAGAFQHPASPMPAPAAASAGQYAAAAPARMGQMPCWLPPPGPTWAAMPPCPLRSAR